VEPLGSSEPRLKNTALQRYKEREVKKERGKDRKGKRVRVRDWSDRDFLNTF